GPIVFKHEPFGRLEGAKPFRCGTLNRGRRNIRDSLHIQIRPDGRRGRSLCKRSGNNEENDERVPESAGMECLHREPEHLYAKLNVPSKHFHFLAGRFVSFLSLKVNIFLDKLVFLIKPDKQKSSGREAEFSQKTFARAFPGTIIAQ